MDYYIGAFNKYAVFSGRATRKEYWMFILINSIITVALSFLFDNIKGLAFIPTIYGLATLIPILAIGCRRLHDVGKSGWWLLIMLVPFIGSLVLLVFAVMDSQTGTNKYGPNPKGEGYVQKSAGGLIALVISVYVIGIAIMVILVSVVFAALSESRNAKSAGSGAIEKQVQQEIQQKLESNK